MKIRGMLKKTAVLLSAAAIPGMAMADTVEDEIGNVTGAADTAQVTITLLAEVGGFLNFLIRDRGVTTLVAPQTGSPLANPQQGSVDFGTVDAAGNGGATGVKTAPGGGVDDQFYIAELEAEVFYTGISQVDIGVTGTAATAAQAQPKFTCGSNALGAGAWGSTGFGNALAATGTIGNCHSFTGAGGTAQTTNVDIAYLITQATASGTYSTDFTFTATPTVL